jgi:threonine/homoserine/homoserine lactone efflux protein
MLYYLYVFTAGLIFSFIGSIPPGTLNITVLQLGLENKKKIALRFALAVALIEYPYAWIAVTFEGWLTSTPVIIENFQLITAVLMTVFGIITLWMARKPSTLSVKFSESGFRRGIVLSLLNPMAIPYWMAATAYFKAQGWIDLSTTGRVHSYVFGTSVGALLLLTLFIFMATRLASHVKQNLIVKLMPGIIMLVLGIYAFVKYLF